MASSPFHGIRDALTQSAEGIRGSAGRLPNGTSGEGAAAEAIAGRLQRVKRNLTHAAAHMESNAGRADTVAHADDELTRHPSPAQVTEATAKSKAIRIRMKAGEVTPAQAAPIINGAEEMRKDRDAAFNVHANSLVSMEEYNPPNSGGSDYNEGGYNNNPYGDGGGGGDIGTLNPNSGGNGAGEGGAGAGSDGGAGSGGSAIAASDIGTSTSGDGDGRGGSALGSMGQPTGQPQMPQMQPQGGAQPGAGGAPTGMSGGPASWGLKPLDKKGKKGDDSGVPTGLSGGAVVPVSGGDNLGPKGGSSVHGVTTGSDTSGKNANSVSATGAKPGGAGGGPAGGMGRGGGMMGGGGLGSGNNLKGKEKPDIKSSDPTQYGHTTVEDAVKGGSIGRDTAEKPDLQDELRDLPDKGKKKG